MNGSPEYTAHRRGYSVMTVVGLGFVVMASTMIVDAIRDGITLLALVALLFVVVGAALGITEYVRRGQLVLRADARGLELGPSHDVLIPWSAVLELRIRRWADNGPQLVVRFADGWTTGERRVSLGGWRLDRRALRAVVLHHAPHVRTSFGGEPPAPPPVPYMPPGRPAR